MIASGAKGTNPNFMSIKGMIGSFDIDGKRMQNHMYDRTHIYFYRYATNPESKGFSMDSYRDGLSPKIFGFAAQEARFQLISGALSTATTGFMNREACKVMETLISNNMRQIAKDTNIVQLMYGDLGVDPRRVESVRFPLVKLSTKQFDNYHCKISQFDKKYRNKNMQQLLDGEFKNLVDDRIWFRTVFLQLEERNIRGYKFTDKYNMPVNIYRMMKDTVYFNKDVKFEFDPVFAINSVMELCDTLGYIYFNEYCKDRNMRLPKHILHNIHIVKVLIRSHLCCKTLTDMKIGTNLLPIVIAKIKNKYKEALIEFGWSAGIITVQSISEPLTQFVLNSKHRSGNTGTKTNRIVRINELYAVKDTDGKSINGVNTNSQICSR
jgi:hypothetical protein